MQNMINKELLFALLLVICELFATIDGGVCPQKEIISPCLCENNRTITCNGSQTLNLKQVFRRVSLELNDGQKNFTAFNLSNTAIKALEDNTFHDITFEYIYIYNATNLERIESNAFSGPNLYSVRYFFQSHSSKLFIDGLSVNQTFTAISSLVNVTYIYFYPTLLKSIPYHAFDIVNGFQNKLNRIGFYSSQNTSTITSVENNAFYYLNNLDVIELNDNRINKISAHSFDSYRASNPTLAIMLYRNQIGDNSIEIGAFTNTKRQLHIEMHENLLTYLDERVFANVLKENKGNQIWVEGNPFVCDCRMYWLVRDRALYANQVRDGHCVNGKSLSALTFADFISCED